MHVNIGDGERAVASWERCVAQGQIALPRAAGLAANTRPVRSGRTVHRTDWGHRLRRASAEVGAGIEWQHRTSGNEKFEKWERHADHPNDGEESRETPEHHAPHQGAPV